MKKALIGLVALVAIAVMVSAQSIDFTIERPRMRELNVFFSNSAALDANCEAFQRVFIFDEYRSVLNFTIKSGQTYRINQTSVSDLTQIQRDWKFVCLSGDAKIIVNSVYVMGGIVITTPPRIITETVTTTVTQTQTTTPPSCPSQGYILPAQCGSYGWYSSCHSCCPSCHGYNEHCDSDSDCCGGLYCQWSSHKCKHIS